MPKAARERGYEPRPQEPHSLRQSAVTGDALRMSEILWLVTERGTNVKCVLGTVTVRFMRNILCIFFLWK